MKTEIMIAVLALLCIGSLAAVFVLWAKLDEQKKATAEEYNRRWDEISRAVGIENELEQSREREKRTAESVQWYADQLADCEWRRRRANNKNRDLQDHLSALLCPMNDHVWKDGVCVKCGRLQDAID